MALLRGYEEVGINVRFLLLSLAVGFNFNAFSQKRVTQEATAAPADGLAEFRRHLTATSHPPGPGETWLAETVIHAEDIRRPLGIKRNYPRQTLTRVADFTKRTNTLLGAKRRIAGLQLRATDAEWSAGSGPEVNGPLLSLILAMTGRAAALDDLAGDGLPTLRSRV